MNTVKVQKDGTIKVIPKEYLSHYVMAGWVLYKGNSTTTNNAK